MPQLVLAPWFYTFICTWAVLLIILVPMIITTTLFSLPCPWAYSARFMKTEWQWPWK